MNADMMRLYQWVQDQYQIEKAAFGDPRKSTNARLQHSGRAQAYLMMAQYMLHGSMYDEQGSQFYRIIE